MEQTILSNSCFKNYFQTEKRVQKVLGEIADLLKDKQARDLKSYEYILKCTNVYNRSDEDDAVVRYLLLSMYYENNSLFPDKNQAFTVFYLVCLHFYRSKQVAELHDTLERYVGTESWQFSLEDYPMLWDISCRYSVITHDHRRLLESAAAGQRAMPNNPAMGNSYVSAVCGKSRDMYYRNVTCVNDNFPRCFLNKAQIADENITYEESLVQAYIYTREAIAKNPNYSKYYCLFAELLFYTRVYLSERGGAVGGEKYKDEFLCELKKLKSLETCDCLNDLEWDDLVGENAIDLRENIELLVALAKRFTTLPDEISRYNQFLDMALSCFDKRPGTVFAKKNKILAAKEFKDCLKVVNSSVSKNYIIVSYARKDYKAVLCDIIELQSRGVQIIFDEHLDETSDRDGKTWDEKYETLLKSSKAVLCFFSEDYIVSDSVAKEVVMMKTYEKPVIVIDLTQKKQVSSIIQSAIKNGATMSSVKLRGLLDVFDDDVPVIPREESADANSHILKVERVIRNECEEVFTNVTAQALSVQNKGRKTGHINEDFYICNKEENIYVVADGITRQEGYADADYSLSAVFTQKFCEQLRGDLAKNLKKSVSDIPSLMRKAFVRSSMATMSKLNDDPFYAEKHGKAHKLAIQKGAYFEPVGCVCAVAVIENGTLYYGHVGDCGMALVRNGQLILLTHSQTYYAFGIDKVERDREKLYRDYVNVENNPHGYGVVNGDERVKSYFHVTSTELQSGDVVYLMSDGVFDFFRDSFCNQSELFDPAKIFAEQEIFAGENADFDDRTMIRITY